MASSAATGGVQRIVLDPGNAVAAGGGVTVRFVVRTTGSAVVSVPAIAVHRDRDATFVVVHGRGGRRRRVPVTEVGSIGGRSILEGADALAGVDDVIVT